MSDPISMNGMASTIMATKLIERSPTTSCNPKRSRIKSRPTEKSKKTDSSSGAIMEARCR